MSESHRTISKRTRNASPGPRGGRRPVAAALIALTLAIAACGSDSDSTTSSPTTTTTVSTGASATSTTQASSATATTTTAAATPTISTAPPSKDCPTFKEQAELPVQLCDKGSKVTEVQQALADQGDDIVVDGFFGAQTKVAVLEFQAANGLEVDGIVGPLTFAKLTES